MNVLHVIIIKSMKHVAKGSIFSFMFWGHIKGAVLLNCNPE